MFKPRGRFRVRMRQRKQPKTRSRLPFQKVFVISLTVFMVLTILGLWIVNNGIQPTLTSIAQARTENIATKIINASVNKQLEQKYNSEEFLDQTFDNNGNRVSAMIDAGAILEVASTATLRAQNMLKTAEEGHLPDITLPEGVEIKREQDSTVGIVYYIPLGMATGNALLSNLGPRVPVRFHIVGNVESSILQKTEPIPINNALMEIKLRLSAEINVVVPFETEPKEITTDFPLFSATLWGDVPYYYGGGNASGNGNDVSPMIPLPKDGKWREIN